VNGVIVAQDPTRPAGTLVQGDWIRFVVPRSIADFTHVTTPMSPEDIARRRTNISNILTVASIATNDPVLAGLSAMDTFAIRLDQGASLSGAAFEAGGGLLASGTGAAIGFAMLGPVGAIAGGAVVPRESTIAHRAAVWSTEKMIDHFGW